MWNLETVCKQTETRRQVFSLSKSECLTQQIQMQLSPNLEKVSEFFSTFSESA